MRHPIHNTYTHAKNKPITFYNTNGKWAKSEKNWISIYYASWFTESAETDRNGRRIEWEAPTQFEAAVGSVFCILNDELPTTGFTVSIFSLCIAHNRSHIPLHTTSIHFIHTYSMWKSKWLMFDSLFAAVFYRSLDKWSKQMYPFRDCVCVCERERERYRKSMVDLWCVRFFYFSSVEVFVLLLMLKAFLRHSLSWSDAHENCMHSAPKSWKSYISYEWPFLPAPNVFVMLPEHFHNRLCSICWW